MVIFHSYVSLPEGTITYYNQSPFGSATVCYGKSPFWIGKSSLVGGIPTPLKNMTSSVGMIIPNLWKVIKAMSQTTNQNMFILYRRTNHGDHGADGAVHGIRMEKNMGDKSTRIRRLPSETLWQSSMAGSKIRGAMG